MVCEPLVQMQSYQLNTKERYCCRLKRFISCLNGINFAICSILSEQLNQFVQQMAHCAKLAIYEQ